MIRSILSRSRPAVVLLAALAYFLGAGVARYLGIPPDAGLLWLGLGWVVFLQAGTNLLVEAFRGPLEPLDEGETPRERLALRSQILLSASALLVLAGTAALSIIRDQPSGTVTGILFASLLLAAAYVLPPVRLAYGGFGELVLAVLAAELPVALAYFLQGGESQRLLYFVTLPLTFMAIAGFIVLDFSSYAQDLKYGRQTLLVRLGWERALPLVDGLIAGTYLILVMGIALGVALPLIWPALLTIPFGALQIWWLRAMGAGKPPFWRGMKVNAYGLACLLAYLLAYAFWSR